MTPPPRLVPDRPSAEKAIREIEDIIRLRDTRVPSIAEMRGWVATIRSLIDAAAPPAEAPADPKSALVRKAIGQLRSMGEWDGKTFNEDLHATLRELTALNTAVAAEAPAERGDIARVIRLIRMAADAGGATEGQCYGWWRDLTASLAAAPAAPAPAAWLDAFRFVADPAVPNGEIRFVQNGEVVGTIKLEAKDEAPPRDGRAGGT